MKSRNIPWKLLLLGAVLAVPALVGLAQEGTTQSEVKWRTDYKLALKESKDKNLPLVIDFGTKTCRYCILMDQTTFRDPKVISVMNERFIPLKIDAEVEVDLVNYLRIASYPTILLAGPDLKILATVASYKEAGEFHEILQRNLAQLTSPNWLQRDLLIAKKSIDNGNFADAITILKRIIADGRGSTDQEAAGKLLKDLEQRAGERLSKANELNDQGQFSEAIEVLSETQRVFPGLLVSRQAAEMAGKIVQSSQIRNQQRSKRARELLLQAKEYQKNHEYLPCLDRCEVVLGSYGDLPEGLEASLIAYEIKSNAEVMQNLAETMSDRLGGFWLALADIHLKKSQPQQAEVYLQRVIQAFPGTRQAESAQIRMGQLQGLPPRRMEVSNSGQP
jgi:tetratricopeptide (TPR) repeat protein